MSLAPLGEPLVTERDQNGEERLRKNLLYEMNEEALQCAGAIRVDRARRIGGLEVLGDCVGVAQDGGGASGAKGVDYDGERVGRTSVFRQARGCADRA